MRFYDSFDPLFGSQTLFSVDLSYAAEKSDSIHILPYSHANIDKREMSTATYILIGKVLDNRVHQLIKENKCYKRKNWKYGSKKENRKNLSTLKH